MSKKSDLIKNNNFQSLSKAFDTDSLADLLEEASTKGGRQNKWTQKTSFAPSSFYIHGNGICPRYWYYAFEGAEFEYHNTARQRANMDSGTAAGERIAGLFRDAGILVGDELEVRHEDPPIFGFMDLMVNWQGEEMIGEVKTTTTEAFQTRAASMKAPGYQLIQLLIYMKVYNKQKGFFVTENKNTHELLIVPVKMTPANEALINRVFDWMRMVKANKELPKRPFTKSSFNCKNCPVRSTCWDGVTRGSVNGKDPNPGVVDLPPLDVPK